MQIVFVGPPGAGKGTQALRLKDHLGVVHLSTGEMFRQAEQAGTDLGRQAAEYFRSGNLVPDEIVVGIIAERLRQPDCAAGCIFDGFPRTVAQAEALDAMLAARTRPLDLVLALEVADEIVTKRLVGRGRVDDSPETILERLRQYNRLTKPLLDYYRGRGLLRLVDGSGSEDEVFVRIRAAVDTAPAAGD
jgi:adenylate kinase